MELRSPSDDLEELEAKLEEYVSCGLRLGWIIDPKVRRVHVYRQGAPVEVLDDPASVSAAPELPGFVLDLSRIW